MSEADASMFVVLYRWRIRPGHEAQFAEAWTQATQELLSRGSMGSRLHRGDDGLWYGYAQWPSAAVRAAAFAGSGTTAGARMRAAIEESLPETRLTPVADFLQAAHAVAGE
jgi:hypothetical protein